VTHGGDEKDQTPEYPTNPAEEAGDQERGGDGVGEGAVQAGRECVEDVSTVELAAGNEVERGDEQADPAGDEDGMMSGQLEGGGSGMNGAPG